jgi:hypothetical protein
MAHRLTLSRGAGLVALAAGTALGLFLSGCPQTGVVCNPGLTPCGSDMLNMGTGCADLSSDVLNCGVCGLACQQSQVCVLGVCQCQAGALACGASCIVPQTDPTNCGGCVGDGGISCGANQVCEEGQCQASCQLGSSTVCGQSCANTQTDPNNCGTCGHQCVGESCRAGNCSYDVVAACTAAGEVVGLTSGPDTLGPLAPFGMSPGPLADMSGVLLSADQSVSQLHEGRLFDFQLLPENPALDAGASQVVSSDPFVYAVNPLDDTLTVFQRNRVPGRPSPFDWTVDAGLGLGQIASVVLQSGQAPQGAALLGQSLFITLSGNASMPSAGQAVQRVDVSDPFVPALAESYDMTGPLAGLDAGAGLPQPSAILSQNGLLYAALRNLDATTGQPVGPGALAVIDPTTRQVSAVSLGAGCEAPASIAGDGSNLFVACAGDVVRDTGQNVISNAAAGVAMLTAPAGTPPLLTSAWGAACPASGDAGCAIPVPSALTLVGSRLYVGDENGGRLFARDVVGTALVERRGFSPLDGGPPVQACPVSSAPGTPSLGALLTP